MKRRVCVVIVVYGKVNVLFNFYIYFVFMLNGLKMYYFSKFIVVITIIKVVCLFGVIKELIGFVGSYVGIFIG